MRSSTKKLIEDLGIKNLKNIKTKIKEIKNEKTYTIKLIIEGEPKQTQRPRTTFTGHFYVPNAAKNKKEVRKQIKQQLDIENFDIIDCEVKMKIKFYASIPKGFSKTDKVLAEMGYIRPTTTPDIDNLMKTYMDAITGVLWLDDGQVIETHSYKYYSITPRTEIILSYKKHLHCSILQQYAKNKKENFDAKLL